MASEREAIIEHFNKKAKTRKAVVSQPSKPGEMRVTSKRVNGGGLRTSPRESRLFRWNSLKKGQTTTWLTLRFFGMP